MPLTIELTPEQEARLKAAATESGTDPESVLQGLFELLPEIDKPKTGAELLARMEQEGLFNPNYGDPTLDSPDLARAIREGRYPPPKAEVSEEGEVSAG